MYACACMHTCVYMCILVCAHVYMHARVCTTVRSPLGGVEVELIITAPCGEHIPCPCVVQGCGVNDLNLLPTSHSTVVNFPILQDEKAEVHGGRVPLRGQITLSPGLSPHLLDSKVRALKDHCFSCTLPRPAPTPRSTGHLRRRQEAAHLWTGDLETPQTLLGGGVILGGWCENMSGTTSSLYCVLSGKTDTAGWPAGGQEKKPKA